MIQISASRKTVTCRLLYKDNPGILTVDSNPLNFWYAQELKQIIQKFNLENKQIIITTRGSGFVSKVSCARLALAKLVLKLNPKSKPDLYKIDKKILTSNPKKKLPKKPECYGARARRQKSYR